jgi:hypothetical protein
MQHDLARCILEGHHGVFGVVKQIGSQRLRNYHQEREHAATRSMVLGSLPEDEPELSPTTRPQSVSNMDTDFRNSFNNNYISRARSGTESVADTRYGSQAPQPPSRSAQVKGRDEGMNSEQTDIISPTISELEGDGLYREFSSNLSVSKHPFSNIEAYSAPTTRNLPFSGVGGLLDDKDASVGRFNAGRGYDNRLNWKIGGSLKRHA